jgi:hypothetical protein
MEHVPEPEAIRAKILELLAARDPGKTICPSDAARALDPAGFRSLMPAVREAAQALVVEGAIEVTQGGVPVHLPTARGPVRLRLTGHPVRHPRD